ERTLISGVSHKCKCSFDRQCAWNDSTGPWPEDSSSSGPGPHDNDARDFATAAKGPTVDLDGASPRTRTGGVIRETHARFDNRSAGISASSGQGKCARSSFGKGASPVNPSGQSRAEVVRAYRKSCPS